MTDFEKCRAVLLREAELLEKLTLCQEMIRSAAARREWAETGSLLDSFAMTGAEFEAAEAERAEVFAGLGAFGEEGFYRFAAAFPPEERDELGRGYRQLKMESLRLRIQNESFLSYLEGARELTAAFLEEAFPDRKGRLYSRQGTHLPADMRSMVLNQSL